MGVAYKNITVKSDVSRMPLSKSGFDLERGAFYSDLKKNDLKQIGFLGLIRCLKKNAPNDNVALVFLFITLCCDWLWCI